MKNIIRSLLIGLITASMLMAGGLLLDRDEAESYKDSMLAKGWEFRENFPFYRKTTLTGSSPKSCEFSPDGEQIYVTLLGQPRKAVQIYTVNNLERIKTIEPGCKDPKQDYGYAEGVFSPETGNFWFTRMTTGEYYIYYPESDSLEGPRYTHGVWTKALEFSPNSKKVAMTNWVSKTVTVFEADSRKLIKRFKVRNIPRGMAWIGNDTLAVAIYGGRKSSDGGIEIYDTRTGKLQHYIPVYRSAMRDVRYDPNEGMLYYDDMRFAKTYKYDWKAREEIAVIDVDSHPNTIKLSDDGKYLFVSCRGPNNPKGYTLPSPRDGDILVIDTKTFTVTAQWPQGNQPTGLDISEDGRFLATTDFMEHGLNLYMISLCGYGEEKSALDSLIERMGERNGVVTGSFWRWW